MPRIVRGRGWHGYAQLSNQKHGTTRTTGPNKTEQRYEASQLSLELAAGEIASYAFEAIKLRLGHDLWYTPDYVVVRCLPGAPFTSGQLELHEVKTQWSDGRIGATDDSKAKIKQAAELYPWFRFMLVVERSKGVFESFAIPPGPSRSLRG